MNAAAWILIGWFVLNVIVSIFTAGRPRKERPALTIGAAIAYVIFMLVVYTGLSIALLFAIGILR